MALLIIGFFAIALSIGIANGITASPVMSVVIPLIFSLLTFGGGFYVFIKDLNVTTQKAVGVFFIAFSVGYISGLFLGAYAKFNSNSLVAQENQPAYSVFEYTDVRLLNTFYKLDEMMVKSGLDNAQRTSILNNIFNSITQRKESNLKISNWGVEIQKLWKNSEADEVLALLNEINTVIYLIKDEDAENYQEILKLEAKVQALKESAEIEKLSNISNIINDVIDTSRHVKLASPLLTSEEVKALGEFVDTAQSKGNPWFPHMIADGVQAIVGNKG